METIMKTLSPERLEAVRKLLQQLNYRFYVRESGWFECLLILDEERWTGSGANPDEALSHAIRSALPSQLARWLFDQVQNRTAPSETATQPTESAPPAISQPAQPAASPSPEPLLREPSRDVSRVNGVAVQSAQTAVATKPAPVAPPASAVQPAPVPVAPAPAAVAPAPVAEPVKEEEPPPRHASPRDVLVELQALRKQIENDRDELALTAPRRQRLVLLGWIARARAAQMSFPDDFKIDSVVANIARLLGSYCQSWWPGSVRALKVHTRPEDVVADLPLPVGHPPHTWYEACEAAEKCIRAVDEEDEAKGRDEHGWIDSAKLSPAAKDPEAILNELTQHAEALGGPLGAPPTLEELPESAQLLEWSRKLRWIRDTTHDPNRWGQIAGRFRYWAREHPQRFNESVRALDPDYGPEKSWAALLGCDPETIQRKREIREIFTGAPTAEEAPDDATLGNWLARALPYSDTHLPNIVAAMTPFRERIQTLEPGTLPGADRRMRRRLSKLQKELETPTETQPEAPVTPAEPEPPPTPPNVEVAEDPKAVYGPLRDSVVAITRGKRALFVSNRADPALRDRLQELFEFEELEWSQGETKRRQSLVGPITSGSYHFVLGATGFLSHSVDGQIGRACRMVSVPYIRVHRGRPLACLRAMARELGLDASSSAPSAALLQEAAEEAS
jgi:hypothetical protein